MKFFELSNIQLDAVIEEIRAFKSEIVVNGVPNKLIDAYIDGTVKGYNEAVSEIASHFERAKTREKDAQS